MSTPIVVVCFNNYKYVSLMILQLTSILLSPNITILDNGSTEPNTLNYLSSTTTPVIYGGFQGADAWMTIYDRLPDVFVITNADVLFNEDMPATFLDDLLSLSTTYGGMKTGLALRIDDYPLMYPYSFSTYGYPGVYQIWVSQLQFWTNVIYDPTYELYYAPVDNNFFLYNKNNGGQDVRVANIYQMRVLSWYIDLASVYGGNDISRYHRYIAHLDPSDYDPILYFEGQYRTDNNIVAVSRTTASSQTISHLVQLDGSAGDTFWQTTYPSNYNPIFALYDTYLNPAKDYIDIGSWLGDTVFYPSRNSKRVICVEPDPRVLVSLSYLIRMTFLDTPILLEQSAIYSSTTTSTIYLSLGADEYDGTLSRIDSAGPQLGDAQITTLTFGDLIAKYNVTSVSFINLNINGDEEAVLQDVYTYSNTNSVPLYVTFYYSNWLNPDLTRFAFLTTDQQTAIQAGVTSILFNAP